MECPRCGSKTEGSYCLYCGYSLSSDERKDEDKDRLFSDNIKKILLMVLFITFIPYFLFTTSILLWSTTAVLPNIMANSTILFIVLLVPVGLFSLEGEAFLIYYLFLLVSIIASTIFLWYKGNDKLFKKREKSVGTHEHLLDNQMGRLVTIFSALMAFSFVYFFILNTAGITPETPPLQESPLWELAYKMTRAAAWEEIVVRFAFIGVPMYFFAVNKGKKKPYKYLLGGFGLDKRPVVLLIIISSAMFSTAHILGWDLYKMPQTFVAGIFFGYLFAKDGLHSCIVLHFTWNFLSLYSRLGDDLNLIVGILTIVWVGVGIYFFYHYSKVFVEWATSKKKRVEKKVKEKRKTVFKEKGTVGVSAGFVCSNCGGYSAIYTQKGKLRCKVCNQETDPTSQESRKELDVREAGRSWPPME